MSEAAIEVLDALLVRYEHELRSLQAEDFVERIQSWSQELEAAVSGVWLAILEPLRAEIHRCVRELQVGDRGVRSEDYDRLAWVVNERRRELRDFIQHGSAGRVAERRQRYPLSVRLQMRDAAPEVEREEIHPPSTALIDETDERAYPVWFGTDRELRFTSEDQFQDTGAWCDTLTYGISVVHVPKSHTFGSIGSSWLKRVVRRTLSGTHDDRLEIIATKVGPADAFSASIGRELAHWPSKKAALVFVHGYNVSLREAIVRAAQIGFDLKIEGITATFSWPSKGRLIPYPQDEEHIQLSEQHFVDFIERLAQSPGLEEINVLAHSMGNRLLCRTMPQLIERQRLGRIPVPIGHVVLAAADLSTAFFQQHADLYRQLARRRITNYSCAADKALFASRTVHGLGRVGLEPPIFVHDGIDTVSASQLNVDLLGHGYFASAEPLLYDIAELIHHNKPPPSRLRIERGPAALGLHWVLTK
jgi:esterase/lipase superfamily enzyme